MTTKGDAAVAAAVAALHERGERMTAPRQAVIRTMAEQPGHLTAEQVAVKLGEGPVPVHLTTVYRTLERLTELGIVTHVHVGHGPTAYHLTESAHLHAQCRVCGTVIDLPVDLLDGLGEEIQKVAGFELDAEQVVLAGTCARCLGTEATG